MSVKLGKIGKSLFYKEKKDLGLQLILILL